MLGQTEFLFMQKILRNLHLPVHVLTDGALPDASLDMGLRRFLGLDDAYRHLFGTLPRQLVRQTIYKVTDSFLCTYLFLRLPQESSVLLIGPYMTAPLTHEQLLQDAQNYAISPTRFRQMEALHHQRMRFGAHLPRRSSHHVFIGSIRRIA